MSARVLCIGLDSFDADLMREWIAAGHLPTFERLLQTSLHGSVISPPALCAGSTWPSFQTGVSPARHRRVFRQQVPLGEYADQTFLPSAMAFPAFWEALSRAGRRLAVLDVPHSHPIRDLNGWQLCDWSCHDAEDVPTAVPPSFGEELIQRFGTPVRDHCYDTGHDITGMQRFLADTRRHLEYQRDVALYCLAAESWDLLTVVLSAAHCAGHQAWFLHDAAHPRYDAAAAARLGDPLLQVYAMIDKTLAELLSEVGDDCLVLAYLSHGIGPLYGEPIIFDEVLQRLDRAASAPRSEAYGRLKRFWHALPASIRHAAALRRLRRRLTPALQSSLLVPGRANRSFFAVPNNPHSGAIRINLEGREKHGIVPHTQYHDVCLRLREEFLALVDADTGEAIVSDVVLTHEAYTGPFIDEMPDVFVEWRRGPRAPRVIRSPSIAEIRVPIVEGRSGDHRPTSMFLARGAGIRPGAMSQPVSVYDLAPTMAAWLGVRLDDVDGQVINALLTARAVAST